MKRRLYARMFALSLAMTLLTAVLLIGTVYPFFRDRLHEEMFLQTQLLADGLEHAANEQAYLASLGAGDTRVTLLDGEGNVLFDTDADAASMERHQDRPEIAQALSTGRGEDTRHSRTVLENLYYSALRLADGRVLRLARPAASAQLALVQGMPALALVFLLCLCASLLLSGRFTRSVLAPLERIDMEHPETTVCFDELQPFVRRIARQQEQLAQRMQDLVEQRDRIASITSHMREGLVFVDADGAAVMVNESALDLLGARGMPWQGAHFVRISRSAALREALEAALHGENVEGDVDLTGHTYRFVANPVYEGAATGGAILLLSDVTERRRAERMRREFTANVSHELRSPLTSIAGFAEMMACGMVREADMKECAARIKREADRMVTLIGDILRLSQLDELTPGHLSERVPLLEVVRDVEARLRPQADARAIALRVQGEPCAVRGDRVMLEELVQNLCDNAIKYNKDGGRVEMTLHAEGAQALLCVRDTGIGIPREHQSRVFERFYRVDKSRSKKTGGTGLGLSIVRHVAEAHGGSVRMISAEGEGTTFEVRLPLAR